MRRSKDAIAVARQVPVIVEGDDPFLEPSSPLRDSPTSSGGLPLFAPLQGVAPVARELKRPPTAVNAKAPHAADDSYASTSAAPASRIIAANPALKVQRVHEPRAMQRRKRNPPFSPAKRRVPARRKRAAEDDDELDSVPRRRRRTEEDHPDDEEVDQNVPEPDDDAVDFDFAPLSKGKARALVNDDGGGDEQLPTIDEVTLAWNEDGDGPIHRHLEARGLRPPRTTPRTRIAAASKTTTSRSASFTRSSRTLTSVPTSTRRVRLTPSQITSSIDAEFSRAASRVSSRRSAASAASASKVAFSFSQAAATISSRRSAQSALSASRSRATAASVSSLLAAAESAISSREGLTPTATAAPTSSGVTASSAAPSASVITTTSATAALTSTLSSSVTSSISSSSSSSVSVSTTSISSSSSSSSSSTSSTTSSSASTSASASATAASSQSNSSNARLRSILIPSIVIPLGLLLLAIILFICTKRRNRRADEAGTGGNQSSWGGSTNYGATGTARGAAGLTAAGGAAAAAGSYSGSNPSQDSFGTSPSAIGVAYGGHEPRSKWGRRSLVDVIAGGIRAAGTGGPAGAAGAAEASAGRGRGQVISTSSSFGGGRQPSMTGLSDYAAAGLDYQPGQMRPVTTPSILGDSISGSHAATPVPQQRYDSPQYYDPFAPTIIPVAAGYAHRSSSDGLVIGEDNDESLRGRGDAGSFEENEYEHDPTRDSQVTERMAAPSVPWTQQSGLGFLAHTPRQSAPPPLDRTETVQTKRSTVTALTHQTNESSTDQEVYYTDVAPSGQESGLDSSDEEHLDTPTILQQPVDFGSSGSSNEGAGHGSGSSRGSLSRGRASSVHSERSSQVDGTPRLGMGHGNTGGVRRGDGSWW